MLDFRIETFLCVCRSMNYTRAAEELHITQPAVSQHIHYLEQKYGARLFSYTGKQLKITEAGRLLQSAALSVRHDEGVLRERMVNVGGSSRALIFGATRTIGDFVMPGVLAGFLRRFPDAVVRMQVENTDILLSALEQGTIDFAVVEGIFEKNEYESVSLSREPYIAVSAPAAAQACEAHQLEELLGERLLVREKGSGTRQILELFLQGRNLSVRDFRQVTEIGSLHVLKELCMEGCGITFLYEAAVKKELEAGLLKKIPLQDFIPAHDFTFLWRKGSLYGEEYREICGEWKWELVSSGKL